MNLFDDLKGYKKKIICVALHCTLFSLSFFLMGCTSSSLEKFSTFPRVDTLQATVVDIPPVFRYPMDLLLLNDVLVVSDIKSDFFFHVFRLPRLEYADSYIRRGHGPGEEVFINPRIRRTSGNQFFYQTFNHIRQVVFYSTPESLSVHESIMLENNLFSFQHMFRIDSLYYGYHPEEGQKEFRGFIPATGHIFDFGSPFPDFGRTLKPYEQKRLQDKNISVKPDHSRFAASYLFFPMLRIFDSNQGQVLREVRYQNGQLFPEAVIAERSTREQQEMIMNNYRSIKSTDRFIYVIYVGRTNKNLLYRFDDLKASGDHSDEIHVYDWEGNPVKKIILDRSIFSFEVDPDDKYLIASSVSNLEQLFLYPL